MKLRNNNNAISEITGTLLLIAVAVSAFSGCYYYIFSSPTVESETNIDIVGLIEGNNIVFIHRGGEELNLDTKITVIIDGVEVTEQVNDLLDADARINNLWNIGERAVYDPGYGPDESIEYKKVEVTVVDLESNSIIMTGILQ